MAPLFFVRGGCINPGSTSKFNYAGLYGDYWSSRASSNTNHAYELYFSSSSVNPSNAGAYLTVPDVNGLLVGSASLIADQFVEIVEIAKRVQD